MHGTDTAKLLVGDATEYFFDDLVIETAHGLTRTVHQPEKLGADPVVKSDKPWERVTYFSCNTWTLWRAEEEFRLLYTDWHYDREGLARCVAERVAKRGMSIYGIVDWSYNRYRQLYAFSRDGVEWTKPDLDLHREDGRATNIVFGDEQFGSVYNLCPVEDPYERDPARRYKALYTHVPADLPAAAGTITRIAYSADGIHWEPAATDPTFGRCGWHLDDVAIGAQDPASRSFLLFTRHPYTEEAPGQRRRYVMGGTPTYDQTVAAPLRRNRRRIFLSESSDFVHWSEPELLLAPESGLDNIDDAFYGLTPLCLGNQWIGFLNCFHMVTNTMNVELVHSRDGRRWTRIHPTHPWLDRGGPGSFDEFMVNIPSRPVTLGDQVFVFYGGAKNHHDWWQAGPAESMAEPEYWRHLAEVTEWDAVGYHLGLAKLRRDGYVSLDARLEREGMLLTQPLLSAGDRLVLNAKCGDGGYIKVAVTDYGEQPFPGHSIADCDAFTGDSTQHVVTWRTDPEIRGGRREGPLGMPFRRLLLYVRNAELYSFRFVESSNGNARLPGDLG